MAYGGRLLHTTLVWGKFAKWADRHWPAVPAIRVGPSSFLGLV